MDKNTIDIGFLAMLYGYISTGKDQDLLYARTEIRKKINQMREEEAQRKRESELQKDISEWGITKAITDAQQVALKWREDHDELIDAYNAGGVR